MRASMWMSYAGTLVAKAYPQESKRLLLIFLGSQRRVAAMCRDRVGIRAVIDSSGALLYMGYIGIMERKWKLL